MIPVPASFQDFYTDKDIREFTGDVWYETDAFIPETMKGNRCFLRFGAATHRAEVFINGTKAGEHEGGFLPFLADITGKARYGAVNTVTVKVNNELNETNIPCGRTITLRNGKKMTKPYFDFYNYSGLQRSVYLSYLNTGEKHPGYRPELFRQRGIGRDKVQHKNCRKRFSAPRTHG